MKVLQFVAVAALLAAPTTGFGALINGDVADAFAGGQSNSGPIDGGNSVGTQTGNTLKVGRIGGADNTTLGRAAVYVFQLPNLGAVANPFSTASLSFGVQLIDDATTADADLYGLGRRAASTVVAGDYYFGNAADTTDATLLQTSILTPSLNAGSENTIISTDANGNANLAAYLNAQYAGGAGVNEYVFLRLNVDGGSTAARGYNVHTANDPDVAKRPTIEYTAVPEPASLALVAIGGLAIIRRRRSC